MKALHLILALILIRSTASAGDDASDLCRRDAMVAIMAVAYPDMLERGSPMQVEWLKCNEQFSSKFLREPELIEDHVNEIGKRLGIKPKEFDQAKFAVNLQIRLYQVYKAYLEDIQNAQQQAQTPQYQPRYQPPVKQRESDPVQLDSHTLHEIARLRQALEAR